MNYRHAFHAGNFADLVKHAALTVCLELMTRNAAPLLAIDTHAGAGGYDLSGEEARKSGEADDGVAVLMADPAPPEAFDILIAVVSRINAGGPVRLYPGSPALMAAALRPDDRLIACEKRPDEHARLVEMLAGQGEALEADGFATAPARTAKAGQVLVHIDPPFEAGDDYARAVEASAGVLAKNPSAVIIIWTPLKDLETFDRFLRRVEDAIAAPTVVAEARLRPLDNPMAMNGCALTVLNPPAGLVAALEEICCWTAQKLGQGSAGGRVYEIS